MPIAPDLRRKYYGPAWQRFRRALIERHGTVCPGCRTDWPRYLNLCHLDHDPRVSSRVGLLCPVCHGRYDSRQTVAVSRRTRARRNGQLWLSVELEFAPVPESLWPKSAIRELQGELFG
jgi:hypothetical protein